MKQGFAPFCLRVAHSGDNWREFSGSGASRELDTIRLVIEAPEFLGLFLAGEPLPRAAAPAPQAESGHVLLAVTETGGVMVVACPDAATPMNTLVSEVLAANGWLWRQSYERLADPFERFLGMSLVDWISRRVGPDWSADAFRKGTENSLLGGRFPVVLFVEKEDPIVKEAVAFLVNMNLEVRLCSWDCWRFGGNEVVRPRLLAVRQPAAASPAKPTGPAPVQPKSGQISDRPVEPAAPAQRRFVEEHVSATAFGGATASQIKRGEPFPNGDWSERQKEILDRLTELDVLGLVRRGFGYYVPGSLESGTAEAAIVVSVQADRWPTPGRDEVIVVVRSDLLGGWLDTPANEIEDFLGSLRRAQRKEHKGAVLLLATSVNEAGQIVNELKALKELAASGLR